MSYYQFSIYRKNGQLVISDITEKSGTSPFPITNNGISRLNWFDQEIGKSMLFVSHSKEILQAFLDGVDVGMNSESLL